MAPVPEGGKEHVLALLAFGALLADLEKHTQAEDRGEQRVRSSDKPHLST